MGGLVMPFGDKKRYCCKCKVELTPKNHYYRNSQCKSCAKDRLMIAGFKKLVKKNGTVWAEKYLNRKQEVIDMQRAELTRMED